jgi:O-antigen ligase
LSRQTNISGNWLFFIFFHLTILKILPHTIGKQITGGIVLFAIFCLVVWSIRHRWDEVAAYLSECRMESLAGILSCIAILVTCLVNFDWHQENWPLSGIMMLSVLASYAFLILSYWLFRLHLSEKGYVFVLFLFVLINFTAFWEYFSFESAKPLLSATIRSYDMKRWGVSSFFPVTTVYGPWAAVTGIFFLIQYLRKPGPKIHKWLELVCGVSGICGAILAGSRTGLIGLAAGLAAIFFMVAGRKKLYISLIVVAAVVFIHLVAFNHTYVSRKVGTFLPYFKHIQSPAQISWPKDFIPIINHENMHSRLLKWQKAVELFEQQPWIGIGLGQYNVKSGFDYVHTAHSVYLGILSEGGVFLFAAVSCFVLMFVWRKRCRSLLAVVIVLMVMGIFEHPYALSPPWNITIAWILSHANSDLMMASG